MSTLLRSTTSTSPDGTPSAAVPRWLSLVWVGFVVAALLMLPALPLVIWGVVVPIVAAAMLAVSVPAARGLPWLRQGVDAVAADLLGWDGHTTSAAEARADAGGPPVIARSVAVVVRW